MRWLPASGQPPPSSKRQRRSSTYLTAKYFYEKVSKETTEVAYQILAERAKGDRAYLNQEELEELLLRLAYVPPEMGSNRGRNSHQQKLIKQMWFSLLAGRIAEIDEEEQYVQACM